MSSTVPSAKEGTWNYGNENYGSKNPFPKIFSDIRQGCQSPMLPGVRGDNLKLNQPVICDMQTQIHSLHFYPELSFKSSPIFLSKCGYCGLPFIFPLQVETVVPFFLYSQFIFNWDIIDITLCKFEVYNMFVGYIYILQYKYHSAVRWNLCHLTQLSYFCAEKY